MISLTVVILTLLAVLGGAVIILRFRKHGFYEEEVRKKQPPGYRASKNQEQRSKPKQEPKESSPGSPQL